MWDITWYPNSNNFVSIIFIVKPILAPVKDVFLQYWSNPVSFLAVETFDDELNA